jgi:hypothetical protein
MSRITFSDGQTVEDQDIIDWCDDLSDSAGREMVLVILANGHPITVPAKRGNRKLLAERQKLRSVITFDDGRIADRDDVFEWIDGIRDWGGNPAIALFCSHAKPMVISDNEFNRRTLPAAKSRRLRPEKV